MTTARSWTPKSAPWHRSILLFAALSLAGCGVSQAFGDAHRTEATIKTELGVDAQVSFRINATPRGKRTVVNVKLMSAPAGEATAIKSKVDQIVERTFQTHVDEVDVAL